ncbi:hypothetical protein L7F22_067211 [Adiantum nelumboides]|nr:hypothetical protein [Adiantum nelumboides]
MAQPRAPLNNGLSIPLVGFGTAGSSCYTFQQIKDAVASAIHVGYRHIDSASLYKSEAAIGEALTEAFRAGILTRDDIFVTSKIWCSEMDDVQGAIMRSLSALKLDYLDLYLIHWLLKFAKHPPTREDIGPLDIPKTWKEMERCAELGLTKAIGVSNFSSQMVTELLKVAKIPPAVNQMHPQWQQKKLRETCKKVNVHVSAWSPLGAPETRWGSSAVIENPDIKAIAEKHGKTSAQVILRWGLQQGVSILPKSYTVSRIAENFQVFDWSLTKEDLEVIGRFKQKKNATDVELREELEEMWLLGIEELGEKEEHEEKKLVGKELLETEKVEE